MVKSWQRLRSFNVMPQMALHHLIRLKLCKDAQISDQWVGDVLLQIIPER